MVNRIDHKFLDEEKLFRAVRPAYFKDMYIEDGRVSSAAFKDKRGLSVDRQGRRKSEECVDNMKEKLDGSILSVLVKQCLDADIYIKYAPSTHNVYHTELHRSKSITLLSTSQAKKLAKLAKIESK